MRPALFLKFVDKAETALVAAIELYNKPNFRYREETFAILTINAWELLLKAKLLKDAANDPKAIRVYEPRRTNSGRISKKKYLKRNRAGSPMTLSLPACITSLDKNASARLNTEIKNNLDALIAIRDSSVHYINASPILAKQVLEIASAAVKNFIPLTRHWFDKDCSDSISLMIPLAFIGGNKSFDSVVVTRGEDHLIKYLQSLANNDPQESTPYSVAVRIQVKLERSKLATATKVQITNDPDAVKVYVTEQNLRERYPWDYKTLLKKSAERYADIKQDKKYHALRKPLTGDARYAHSRFLDPGNPKSGRKEFYSPAIFDVFDKHYSKK